MGKEACPNHNASATMLHRMSQLSKKTAHLYVNKCKLGIELTKVAARHNSVF